MYWSFWNTTMNPHQCTSYGVTALDYDMATVLSENNLTTNNYLNLVIFTSSYNVASKHSLEIAEEYYIYSSGHLAPHFAQKV